MQGEAHNQCQIPSSCSRRTAELLYLTASVPNFSYVGSAPLLSPPPWLFLPFLIWLSVQRKDKWTMSMCEAVLIATDDKMQMPIWCTRRMSSLQAPQAGQAVPTTPQGPRGDRAVATSPRELHRGPALSTFPLWLKRSLAMPTPSQRSQGRQPMATLPQCSQVSLAACRSPHRAQGGTAVAE